MLAMTVFNLSHICCTLRLLLKRIRQRRTLRLKMKPTPNLKSFRAEHHQSTCFGNRFRSQNVSASTSIKSGTNLFHIPWGALADWVPPAVSSKSLHLQSAAAALLAAREARSPTTWCHWGRHGWPGKWHLFFNTHDCIDWIIYIYIYILI